MKAWVVVQDWIDGLIVGVASSEAKAVAQAVEDALRYTEVKSFDLSSADDGQFCISAGKRHYRVYPFEMNA